jgi:hypothetical protein
LDIGYPSVAKTSDSFFTFEADNQSDGKAAVYAANLSTGAVSQVVVNVPSGFVAPVYTGDDRGIVYSYPSATTTGRSLAIEAVTADRLTPIGQPLAHLNDAAYGVIYRRGTYIGPGGNCTASATTLCLSSGRFQVRATFATPQGQQGSAQAVSLTSDTGYFTFFDSSNVELVVKVLNGCSFNQRLWVFAGGLTNVATVVSVTDTATGVTRTYGNPQGTAFQPIQDTSAFATCFTAQIAPAAEMTRAIDGAWNELATVLSPRTSPFAPSEAEVQEAPQSPTPGGIAVTASPEATMACIPDAQSLC